MNTGFLVVKLTIELGIFAPHQQRDEDENEYRGGKVMFCAECKFMPLEGLSWRLITNSADVVRLQEIDSID